MAVFKSDYILSVGRSHPHFKKGNSRQISSVRCTDDEYQQLQKVLIYKNQNQTQWLLEKIREDYKNLIA